MARKKTTDPILQNVAETTASASAPAAASVAAEAASAAATTAATAAAPDMLEKVSSRLKASATNESLKGYSKAGQQLKQGGAALWDRVKEVTVGGGNTAKGALGGAAGLVDKGVAKANGLISGIGGTFGKMLTKSPLITAAVALVGGIAIFKSHTKTRDKKEALAALEAKNQQGLAERAAMPQFDNETARADFVAKYGDRAASQSQSAARA